MKHGGKHVVHAGTRGANRADPARGRDSRQERIELVPFHLQPAGTRFIMGKVGGGDIIDLDATGAAVVELLDSGLPIEAVHHRLSGGRDAGQVGGQTGLDVTTFVRDLARLGYLRAPASTGTARVAPTSSSRLRTVQLTGWRRAVWRGFLGVGVLSLATLAVLAAVGRWRLPPAGALAPRGLALPLALLVLLVVGVGTAALHEGAHVLVAKLHGLRPRVRAGRRGGFLVAQTDLTGTWILPPSLRWRPLAAGILLDLDCLAICALLRQLVGPSAEGAALLTLVDAVLVARMLWQCQWYLRTDLYFLAASLTGCVRLRQTAWDVARLWLRRVRRESKAAQHSTDAPLPPRERRVAIGYLLSLPVAGAATLLLWTWALLPALGACLQDLLGGRIGG